MAISKIEQLLIGFLETSKASEPEKTLAFLAMDTEEQMLKLCHFLSENPEATSKTVYEAAKRISKE